MNRDQVGPSSNKLGQIVIWTSDHEVHIKEDIVCLMNRLDHCWSKRNIIDKMAVHDIQMHPICSSVNRAGGFSPHSAEVGGKEGRGDNAISVVPLFHAAIHKVKTGLRRVKKIDAGGRPVF